MSEAVARHVLVVDDEPQVQALLCNLLEREGFAASRASSGAEMHGILGQRPFSLITLDLNLGGEDGLALAREIRARHDIPIIMITAKDSDIDRVVGLELGADDYIVKPFNVREVLARIRAVLRRYEQPAQASPAKSASLPSTHERFRVGPWVLDITARTLTADDGSAVDLTTAEFNLLELFVRRSARVLSRDAIMDLLKGHTWSPLDRSIDTLVGRLRKKVERDVDAPALIKTVRGIGYVLAADVTRV